MSFSSRKILFALILLLLIGGSISALTKVSPARKSPTAPALKQAPATKTAMQLLKHEDGELIVEWNCPDIQLEHDSASHRISGIDMPGAQLYQKTGVPRLPELTRLLDCLPGRVSAEVLEMDAETRPLGAMAAMPEDVMIDPPVDSARVGGGSLDDTRKMSFSERSARTPLIAGMWPPQIVTVREGGNYRGHRLMSLHVYPVQVDAQHGIAHIARRIKVRVTMPRSESATNRLPDQPHETELLRRMLGDLAPTALATRMPEALEGRGAEPQGRLDDFDPAHPRWKIIVNRTGVVRVDATDLRFAGCQIEQITAHDTHIKNRGHEIPIHFSGEEDDRFNDNDYIEFFGQRNERTYLSFSPTMYNDPWTDENVYWLSWGDNQPGLRLADEDASYHPDWHLCSNCTMQSVRTSMHFEQDFTFQRLPFSTDQFAQTIQSVGPLGTYEDHWFWGKPIDGLTSRNFLVYLPFPVRATGSDPAAALRTITMRAALQGYTYGAGSDLGQHRAIVYLNGQSPLGLQAGRVSHHDDFASWQDQTPVILSTRSDTAAGGIVNGDLIAGYNTVTVSLPGDGLAGPNDQVLANWFEIEYNRELRAGNDGSLLFPFDTTRGDTFAFEVRGFFSSNIAMWKVNHSRLTNLRTRLVSPADEGSSWAASFQLIADGPYQMLLFDDRYVARPLAVMPETSNRNLRTMNGARYLIIYHDSFGDDPTAKPWLDRLDSLRRVTFDGSVDTIRVSQIYEQFNDGIVNPDAIRNFLKYAYEHWPVRPTHVCLVGDGVLVNKGIAARAGDLISSLYPLTDQYGSTASDMLFGCVAGPPWDITPDIAVGRISCRSAAELSTYVKKLIAYEDPTQSAYNSLYHCTVLAVADKRDSQFDFPGGFSEPMIKMLPPEINVARAYVDSIQSGQAPNVVRDDFHNGAVIVNYNGHGGGSVWSLYQLMTFNGVSQLNNHRALPFITNFTCYVGAFDDIDQAAILGEAFEFAQNSRLEPVGGIGVYAPASTAYAFAGQNMQLYLYDFCADLPGLTLGEIVQLNKTHYWAAYGSYLSINNYEAMMLSMNLLGDPGVRLKLPNQLMPDLQTNASLVHYGDTLRVSGTLPWDPAGSPSELYLLPFNGDGFSRRTQSYQDSNFVITTNTSHVPAYNTDLLIPLQVTTRSFSNLVLPINNLLHTPQGRLVVYAVNPGNTSTPPQDAIGSVPIFLADSLTGLTVFQIQILPVRAYQHSVTGYIPEDSVFQVQVNLMNEGGVGVVKAHGVFRPAQGPVALDTVEMTQVDGGNWRTGDLGPYHVFGGLYRMRFDVQPPSGGDFVSSEETSLPLEGRNDYSVNSTSGIVPKPVPGKQPMFYVPIGATHFTNAKDVPDLPIRLTATHDTSYTGSDGPHHYNVDSISTTIHVTNLDSLSTLFETWIPTYFWPQSYHVTIMVDPDNIIPELNENNNRYPTQSDLLIPMPNMYPATNALGTFLPRTSTGNSFHRFWQPGTPDTIWLNVSPGSLPVDSSALIYSVPDTLSSSTLAQMALAGLTPPDSLGLRPVRTFRVTLADSSELLTSGGGVRVELNYLPRDTVHNIHTPRGVAIVQNLISDTVGLTLFVRRAESPAWTMLTHKNITFQTRFVGFELLDSVFSVSGRVSGTAGSLGRFVALRVHDIQGPHIELSVDGMHFTPHSILPRHPQIFANLSDLSGINRGPGKFYFILDNDTIPEGQITWSDSLLSSGSMSALIRPDLQPGQHSISVKATDNNGNPDSTTADFTVAGGFGIDWAINYPNPFQRSTLIAYLLTDMTDQFVECKIFTVAGRYIRTVHEVERVVANYREIQWDGRDMDGNEVANGVYFARIRAKQGKQTVEKIIKMAKVR